MARYYWRCQYCGIIPWHVGISGKKRNNLSVRRIHEHTCPQRPEVIASRAHAAKKAK